MGKLKLILLFFLPLAISAQINKLKLGMGVADLKSIYPKLRKNKLNENYSPKYNDEWVLGDTSTTQCEFWTFWFVKGDLDSYDIEIHAYPDHTHQTDTSAYLLLRKQAIVFTKEAEELYGKTEIDTTKMPEIFPRRIKNSWLYYFPEWELGDKVLIIWFADKYDQIKPERYFELSVQLGYPDTH